MSFDFFTPAQLAMLAASTVRCDLVVKFEFVSGPIFAWNGNTKLTIAGNVYEPMYGYGQIEGLEDAGGTESTAVTVSLAGLPGKAPDILAAALSETPEVVQQLLTVSLVLFDENWQPVGSPLPLFFGFMQPPSVTRTAATDEEGGQQTVSVTAENIFFGRSRPPYGLCSDRDQQARSPGDKIFGFVAENRSKTLTYPDYG